MANNDFNKPHFILNSNAVSHNFTYPNVGGGDSQTIPPQNRLAHSGKLRGDLATISTQLKNRVKMMKVFIINSLNG